MTDCAVCGFPKHRHSGGTPNTCPIIATYRPKEATTPTAEAGLLLDWFSGQHRLALDHYSPVYGDDDDQSVEWRVTLESGSINDREWDVVGRGETALAAIRTAHAALQTSARGGALVDDGGKGAG